MNKVVEKMMAEQQKVRNLFGQELMLEQIKIDNDLERKEALKHCEGRIAEMRSILISKEV